MLKFLALKEHMPQEMQQFVPAVKQGKSAQIPMEQELKIVCQEPILQLVPPCVLSVRLDMPVHLRQQPKQRNVCLEHIP